VGGLFLSDCLCWQDSLNRYREVAVMLTGDGNATPEDGAAWLADMNSKMGVPGLAHWGVSMADAAATSELVDKSQVSSSMQVSNPHPILIILT